MVAGPGPRPHHLRPLSRQLRRTAGRRCDGRSLEKASLRVVIVLTIPGVDNHASLHLAQDCNFTVGFLDSSRYLILLSYGYQVLNAFLRKVQM